MERTRPKRIDYHAIVEQRYPELLWQMVIRDAAEFYGRCSNPDEYAESGWVPRATIDEIKRREALAERLVQ